MQKCHMSKIFISNFRNRADSWSLFMRVDWGDSKKSLKFKKRHGCNFLQLCCPIEQETLGCENFNCDNVSPHEDYCFCVISGSNPDGPRSKQSAPVTFNACIFRVLIRESATYLRWNIQENTDAMGKKSADAPTLQLKDTGAEKRAKIGTTRHTITIIVSVLI